MGHNRDSYRRTAAFIALHARRRPGHPAVIRDQVPITYAALQRDLTAMTQALAGFGLPAGAVVAVGHEDLYIQLLLVFGLESLGMVTASFRADEDVDDGLFAAADLVLAQRPRPAETAARVFTITPDWLRDVLAAALPPVRPLAPAPAEGPAVIFRSSGTTGRPKRMVLTHRMFAVRLHAHHKALGLSRDARFLANMHLSVGSIYRSVNNCLRLGATFICYTGGTAAAQLALRPTHMTFLPYHLRLLLARLPACPAPLLPALTVQGIGAKMPDDLRRLALQKLGGKVRETYGTNESGSIGEAGADGLITLAAGVEVEIVDEQGVARPAGQAGLLRVRGPAMVAGYAGDPLASATMFRDGWFTPGDIAAIVAPGRLRLTGRREDVVNRGGIKTACADLESGILAVASLVDVAIWQRDNGTASPTIVVCAVGGGAHLAQLAALIRPIINFPFHLRLVPEIPRTPEGKIKRGVLRQRLEEADAQARAPAQAQAMAARQAVPA